MGRKPYVISQFQRTKRPRNKAARNYSWLDGGGQTTNVRHLNVPPASKPIGIP